MTWGDWKFGKGDCVITAKASNFYDSDGYQPGAVGLDLSEYAEYQGSALLKKFHTNYKKLSQLQNKSVDP